MGIKICSVCGLFFDPISYKDDNCKYCNVELINTEIPRQDYYKELKNNPNYKEELVKKYVYPLGKYSDEKHKLNQIKRDEDQKKRVQESALKRYHEQQTNKPFPKCPTCGSENIKRLDIIDRGLSIGLFGLASKKINKSFECRNCKYTW